MFVIVIVFVAFYVGVFIIIVFFVAIVITIIIILIFCPSLRTVFPEPTIYFWGVKPPHL